MQSTTNRNSLWLGGVIVVVVVGVIAYLALGDFGNSNDSQTLESSQVTPDDSQDTAGDDGQSEPAGLVIRFTDQGFDSPNYRAKAGETVMVRNDSTRSLQFSSDDHPTHRDEPHLNTPVIGPGQTTTFTAPSDPGQYGFHDHIDARNTGVLIVE